MRFEAGLPSKLSELPLALEMQSAVTPLEVSGIQSLKCLIIASQCVCVRVTKCQQWRRIWSL